MEVKTLDCGKMKKMLQAWGKSRFLMEEMCHAGGKALKGTEKAVSSHSTQIAQFPSCLTGYIQTFTVNWYIFNFVGVFSDEFKLDQITIINTVSTGYCRN